jgi:hypothetical protein
LIDSYLGFGAAYGSDGFCNSADGEEDFLSTVAGSGGPSSCATGTPSRTGVVSGSCAGYQKSGWQSVIGNPSDGLRDLPDLSLFGSDGLWGHYYVFCDSDPADEGTCAGAPSGWLAGGGSPFAAPIMAGIQALANQRTGQAQGNPNPRYYALAAKEYGASGSASCNSTLGNGVANSCIFYDLTRATWMCPALDQTIATGPPVGMGAVRFERCVPACISDHSWMGLRQRDRQRE